MWNVKRETSRMTLKVFGLNNRKGGVVIFRYGKTMSRAGFWVEFKSPIPDWLHF